MRVLGPSRSKSSLLSVLGRSERRSRARIRGATVAESTTRALGGIQGIHRQSSATTTMGGLVPTRLVRTYF